MEHLIPNSPVNQMMTEQNKKDVSSTEETYYEGYERVFLPSRGVFYLNEYKNLEKLKVRPLDYSDEDILTTKSFYEDGTIFYELLKNVIVDENNFKARQLVPIDRDTILLWLRSTSLGNKYTVEYACPECGCGKGDKTSPGEITWDLSELDLPEYSKEIYEQLVAEGALLVETPMKKVKVKIVVPTIGMQMELEKRFQKKKQNAEVKSDFFGTTTLLSIVQGVQTLDGKWIYGKDEINSYFKKIHLPLVDSRFILAEATKINLRYNTKQTFNCKDCNHIVEDVEMPFLHRNFFWPES